MPSQSVGAARAALESLHPDTTKYHHQHGERRLWKNVLPRTERSGLTSFSSVRFQCHQQPTGHPGRLGYSGSIQERNSKIAGVGTLLLFENLVMAYILG
jgi:hypothetical protein